MSEATLARASWRDYIEMCKPRVVLLMLLCAAVGMFLATPNMVALDMCIGDVVDDRSRARNQSDADQAQDHGLQRRQDLLGRKQHAHERRKHDQGHDLEFAQGQIVTPRTKPDTGSLKGRHGGCLPRWKSSESYTPGPNRAKA